MRLDRRVGTLGGAALLALATLALLAGGVAAGAQVEPPTVFEIQASTTMTLDEAGNARVESRIDFSAEAYVAFKQAYNPLSTFIRDLKPRSSPTQLENITASLDDANNRLTLSYVELGAATYTGAGKWMLRIAEQGEKVTLTSQSGDTLVFTRVAAAGPSYRIMETVTVKLPPGAANPTYNEADGVLYYTMPLPGEQAAPAWLRLAGAGAIAAGAAALALTTVLAKRSKPAPPPTSEEEGESKPTWRSIGEDW